MPAVDAKLRRPVRAGLLYALAALVVSGCVEAPPEQLEQLRVSVVEPGDLGDDGLVVTGALEVGGDGRDWVLTLTGDGATVAVSVHVPGESWLGQLDGEYVTLELSEPLAGGAHGLALFDDEGLLFVGSPGHGSSAAEERFGEDFVGYGEPLYNESRGDYEFAYTSARFRGDDVQIDVLPGEVENLVVAERTWRVVVNAAYEAAPRAKLFETACAEEGSVLSYEMLRVDEEAPTGHLQPEQVRAIEESCAG